MNFTLFNSSVCVCVCVDQLQLNVVGNGIHIGGLAGDDESRATLGHHFSKSVHGIARTHHVEINDVLGTGLVGRCTCGIDKVHHRTKFGCSARKNLHAFFLQGVYLHSLHVVTTAAEVLTDALQRILADVTQEDLLACADAAHNGSSHTTCTQECHYLLLLVSVKYHSHYSF